MKKKNENKSKKKSSKSQEKKLTKKEEERLQLDKYIQPYKIVDQISSGEYDVIAQ